MPIAKEHLEFRAPDMSVGWETPPGYPPGAAHGPFKSEAGCLLLEMHYYDEAARP